MKAARAGLVEGFGPGFRHLIDHLRASPCGANCNDGVWRLPGGDVYYAAQLRWNTTLPLSPAEVHRIGLEETERLHGEMRAVMRRAGFSGTLPELFAHVRSEEHTYELQSLMRISYAVFCLKKKKDTHHQHTRQKSQ